MLVESDGPVARSRHVPTEIARILPELSSEAPAGAETDVQQARFRLFDAIVTLLRERARNHPALLVLDDLHEADVASLELTTFVARGLRDARVLLIGTYRDAEMRRSGDRARLLDRLMRDATVLPLAGLTVFCHPPGRALRDRTRYPWLLGPPT